MKKIILILFLIIMFILIIIPISCKGEKQSIITTNYPNEKSENSISDNKQNVKSKIPTPKKIEGTTTNKRPFKWEKGKQGGILTLGDYSGDPKTFNIIIANEETSINVIRRFLISLMEYNVDTGEWSVYAGNHNKGNKGKGYDMNITDDNQQILTFYLRDDIFWSDGTQMDAEDWVWYWNNVYCDSLISPSGYKATTIVMENGDERHIKAEKIDTYTFRLIYPRPVGEPELIANISPMPKHILKPYIDSKNYDGLFKLYGIDAPIETIIGNGPWLLTKYIQNESLIFMPNKRFFIKDDWGIPLPYIESLIINIVPDTNALYLSFAGKNIDTYYIQNKDFKQLIEGAEANNYSVWNGGLVPELEFISFNQNVESKRLKDTPKAQWFTKKEFRQAMSYLIDRETISKQIHSGLAEQDNTYITTASPYFNSDIVLDNRYDPQKSLNLLEAIGIRDRDGDNILEDENKNKIKFELNTNAGNQEREKTISILSSEWKTFGILANPSPIEFNVLVTRLTSSYDWDCVLISLDNGLFPLDDNLYLSSGNVHLWNPRQESPSTKWEASIDNLFKKAKYEPDFDKRKKLIGNMLSILYEELPLIPIVRRYSFRATYNKWKNVNWDIWTEIGGYNNLRIFKK